MLLFLAIAARSTALRPLPASVVDGGGAGLRPLPASVLDGEGLVRYFAFGSNLAADKMGTRGKNSSALAYARRWPCVAPGYRLGFTLRGFPPLEPAMASLERGEGACPGCVYEMPRDAYELLWRSEGGAMAKPPYSEIVVPVRDAEGREVDAITLAAEPWARLARDGVPSARYIGIIEQGARELGMVEYADELAAAPRANPSRWLRSVAGAHGVVSILLYRRGLNACLAPLRSACYKLCYGGDARWRRLMCEAATGALLAPTAVAGAAIRCFRAMLGLRPITFGPPE